jgi:hypothetical protein
MFPSHAFNVREGACGFTVTKKARPKQSYDMNLKAWDNKVAAYGLPFWLLLVLKICGRLWVFTFDFGLPVIGLSNSFIGVLYPGMKEGCSGENVLGRER